MFGNQQHSQLARSPGAGTNEYDCLHREDSARQMIRSEAGEALAVAEQLLSRAPNSPEGWNLKALALHKLGQQPAAMEALSRVKPENESPEYWDTKGSVLEKLAKIDEAYQAFSKASNWPSVRVNSTPRHFI